MRASPSSSAGMSAARATTPSPRSRASPTIGAADISESVRRAPRAESARASVPPNPPPAPARRIDFPVMLKIPSHMFATRYALGARDAGGTWGARGYSPWGLAGRPRAGQSQGPFQPRLAILDTGQHKFRYSMPPKARTSSSRGLSGTHAPPAPRRMPAKTGRTGSVAHLALLGRPGWAPRLAAIAALA